MAGIQTTFSTYAVLGGAPRIREIVDELYDRITLDEELNDYFATTDIARLKGHLRGFLTAASGGPEIYVGRSMSDAHAGSCISPKHFERVVGHLIDVLTDFDAPISAIVEMSAQLGSLKQEIAPASKRP